MGHVVGSGPIPPLPTSLREQFWSDLQHWPNPPEFDWVHLPINMVLGADWIEPCRDSTIKPLDFTQINAILVEGSHGFQIPEGWIADKVVR